MYTECDRDTSRCVLQSMNTFSAGPDNDFVADMLKVMNVGRDGGRRRAGYRADMTSKPGRVPLW